jgi:hypothetical protein
MGRLTGADAPKEQVDNALFRWCAGRRIVYTTHFKDLQPHRDEVWEMKTPDIRIFGWLYRPLRFVAAFGDYADLYKGTGRTRSYSDARERVKRMRAELDLDEPKFASGKFDDLVCV